MQPRLTVVTGWAPDGWELYGKRFAETFAQFWPDDVDLIVYGEDPRPLPRGTMRQLMDIPRARETLALYDTTEHRGRAVHSRWKPKDQAKGYNFRLDAWKFCRQGLIPMMAAAELERGELLCWLDGDVYTTRPIPSTLIPGMIPPACDVAYLGRGDKYSEIGFQLYRMPGAMPMLVDFYNLYASGDILKWKEWHSAYAFDIARKRTGARGHDLTPGGRGHVWLTSPLAPYLVHLKGDRKLHGDPLRP